MATSGLYDPVLESYSKNNDNLPIVFPIARQVDDVVNSVVGLAPVEPILNLVRDIMPANVIRSVTGLEKPSEVINSEIDRIASSIRSKVGTRRLI